MTARDTPCSIPPAVYEHLQALRRSQARLLLIRIENGWHCQRIKELLPAGTWIQFLLDNDSGYASVRTIERDMALAAAFYERRHELMLFAEQTSAAAMGVIAALDRDAGAAALEAAIRALQQGMRITEKTARSLVYLQTHAPEWLEQASHDHGALERALQAADALQHLPASPALRSLVLEHRVSNADVIRALHTCAQHHPEQFRDIVVSGAVYNPLVERDIPLGEASSADVQALLHSDEAEREARRQEKLRAWRERQPAPVLDVRGGKAELMLAVEQLQAQGVYRLLVYLSES